MFDKLPPAERVKSAKEKTRRVVDHLLYLIELHENNAIVRYSQTLSGQIPTSFAAHAFNAFQRGLHQFEIVRLCALWDAAEAEKENIPTVIELIDNPDVIETLAQETAGYWRNQEAHLYDDGSDPDLRAATIERLRLSNEAFAQERAQKAHGGLRKTIDESRAIISSSKLASIMNLRHKHLAHSLTHTRHELTAGPVEPWRYGYERDVLDSTLPIVQALYCWVNGSSFSFEDSREIARKNAEALWGACTFDIKR
jgi:hypothetical protein